MPELPEVETICRGLDSLMTGHVIVQVELFRPNLRIPFPPDFVESLEGQRVASIGRRAKYILITLEGGRVLIIHLGMSGKMVVYPARRNRRETHDHVVFMLDNGKEVVFNDARRFGLMTLTTEAELSSHPLLRLLGPEPLSDQFTAESLCAALKGRKSPIKTVIMDNSVVVGVGNIYACESLFDAKISPLKLAGLVMPDECGRLVCSIHKVLRAAIKAGGSTLKDYVQAKGDGGYFQHQFKVYGREGAPCFTCHTPIIRIRQAGRSSFYCPNCQKE